MYAWSCSRTVRARADAPASMCRHARCAHARRWQRMGNKRIPTAPNQLLTGILASIMHSLCLFRRNPADNAACAPRCTAAQPCRPAPSMPLTAKIWIFPKSKTVRSRTHVRSLTFLGHEFCPGGPGQNLIFPVPGIPGQIQIGLANGNPGQATRDEVVQIQIGPANGSRDKRPGTALVPRSAPRIWPASPSLSHSP